MTVLVREGDKASDLCFGDICVACGLCRDCNRYIGTPHIKVCACPDTSVHWYCEVCAEPEAK